jgi:hypothetical protein
LPPRTAAIQWECTPRSLMGHLKQNVPGFFRFLTPTPKLLALKIGGRIFAICHISKASNLLSCHA